MKGTPSIFALRLKAARLAKGLTQEQLGILAGIDEFTASARMNRYEKGIHEPHFDIVEKIAEVLSLPTAYFYCKEDGAAELLILFHLMSGDAKQILLATAKKVV